MVPGLNLLSRRGGGTGPARASPGGGSCQVPGRPHSFDPATPVLMADGSSRPIEDVNVGDRVAATDPQTGVTAAKPVTQLHRNTDRELTDLTVVDQDGHTSTLSTTPNHPFWNDTTQTWTDAEDLTPGTRLKVAGQGEVTVTHATTHTSAREMRDLTIAHTHTYYVIAGTTPVLVHNCGGKAPLTFRGDSRGPDEIFENGFQPWGDDMNLLDHATGRTAKTSGYVSTSYSKEQAGEFNSTHIYTIRSRGGVNVNVKLGDASPWPEEAELAFPGGIKPECISGCIMPNGDWVPNPRFGR